MKIKRFSKLLAVCFAMVFMLFGNMISFADEETHDLRVKFITENGPVTDSDLKLYYAMTTDGRLSGEFASLPIEIGDLTDSENVNRLAYTLASYAADGVGEIAASGVTNGLGYVDFEKLPAGIYLVTGTSGAIGDLIYTPKPALISITETSDAMIEASLKYNVTASGVVRAYTVKKVWSDKDGTARPQSVTVQLLRDSEFYDEVTLSAGNGWSHRWNSLSSDYDWNVIETNIPANYTVSITLEEITFTIENTAAGSSETTETTAPTTTTAVTTTSVTNVTGTDITTDTTPKSSTTTQTASIYTTPGGGSDTPKLPQTGQLWYPVPILFFAGLLLFIIGFLARSGDKHEEG